MMLRDFPTARLGNGSVVHYVDDYRYRPARTLCGRTLTDHDIITEAKPGLPLCAACNRRDYPTSAEFRAYWACTDCGIDTWDLGETAYQIGCSVWELAYPGYARGVGVGSSRPCIGCLERRLGRVLTVEDFIDPTEPQAGLSDRLNQRLQPQRPCPACSVDTDNLSLDTYLAIQDAISPQVLVTAGLMTDIPPCNCPKHGRAKTCVHHSPEWIGIRHRLNCKSARSSAL